MATDGFCPFSFERQPCGKHACYLYRSLEYVNLQGQRVQEWDCIFVHHLNVQISGARAGEQTVASIDKMANVAAGGLQGLLQIAAARAQAALGNGGTG